MKELKRVIKFVLGTKDFGLKLEPKLVKGRGDLWVIVVWSDSDFAGDTDTRISITGYIIFVMGCAVSWKSKAQKSVSLSSSEAEWYALSEAVKEVKFIAQVLVTMDIPVQLPIVVRVDNVGAIFMSESPSATGRTKHVDIRTKFVMQYVEDDFIKIIFAKSEENVSDGFTKNTNIETYERHHKEYVANKDYLTKNNADRTSNNRKGVGRIIAMSERGNKDSPKESIDTPRDRKDSPFVNGRFEDADDANQDANKDADLT
jgi:hypothetical protein